MASPSFVKLTHFAILVIRSLAGGRLSGTLGIDVGIEVRTDSVMDVRVQCFIRARESSLIGGGAWQVDELDLGLQGSRGINDLATLDEGEGADMVGMVRELVADRVGESL